jgi:hypothetical protein
MTDDELDKLLASLPRSGPSPDFADRVTARVTVRQPSAVARPARAVRWPALAAAAVFAVVVIGAMAGSIVWTLGHQELLLSLGQRLAATAGTWAWRAAQDVITGTVRSPGAAALQGLAARPSVLVVGLLAGSLVYLSGLAVLRHLMLVPRQVVYARR